MIAQINMRKGTSAEWAAASPVVLLAGEPGWDTTLKGMKVGDGATEWAELPWIDSKNNPTVNRPNILHNPDFRNPINQRGVSGAISTGTYFFDRWIRNSGTVTVNAGYLTMASGAVIEQRIEGLDLAGATVTASVKIGSNVYSGKGVFPASVGTVDVTLTGFGTATLGYNNAGYMILRFTASGGQNVEVVKLEVGAVSTLHLDPPMDHAVELAKCQRFYYETTPKRTDATETNYYNTSFYGLCRSENVLVGPFYYPVTMRYPPTVTLGYARDQDFGGLVGIGAANVKGDMQGIVLFVVTSYTSGALSVGSHYSVSFSASADL